ncbi:MAG: hypothetical protein PWQ96_1811 [Clostridia bacterium]|jgi:hypothetical protein|nr:hypothetical protein [Clostridia bacterium]
MKNDVQKISRIIRIQLRCLEHAERHEIIMNKGKKGVKWFEQMA